MDSLFGFTTLGGLYLYMLEKAYRNGCLATKDLGVGRRHTIHCVSLTIHMWIYCFLNEDVSIEKKRKQFKNIQLCFNWFTKPIPSSLPRSNLLQRNCSSIEFEIRKIPKRALQCLGNILRVCCINGLRMRALDMKNEVSYRAVKYNTKIVT